MIRWVYCCRECTGGMAQGTCHDCGEDIQVASWDDAALSGAVVLLCQDCSEDAPEQTLWDVSALEEAHEEWPSEGDHPNLVSNHPLGESSDWVIRNRYQDRKTYLDHLRASWTGEVPDNAFEDVEVPDKERWEIFVRDADDEVAIKQAREYLNSQKEKMVK